MRHTVNRGTRSPSSRLRMLLAGLLFATLVTPRLSAEADTSHVLNAPPCSASQLATTGQALPPTSVATIQQAYACLLAHYPTGQGLKDQVLLHGAMVGLIAYLVRRDENQAAAVLPALSGNHATDWQAFRQIYVRIAARLALPAQRGLAQAAIAGLVASLQDDHARYAEPVPDGIGKAGSAGRGPAGPGQFGSGLRLSADQSLPARTMPPLFIVAVDAASPAAHAGLRAGDIITGINGLPPFVQGVSDDAVLGQLDGAAMIHLSINRPSTGRTLGVTLTSASYPASQAVTARVLPGDVAYVRLTSFVDNAANYVFAALNGLTLGTHTRGLVLDLRGNGGGSAAEPALVLGAFVHHRIFAYFADGQGRRTPTWTDAQMPLVHVPLIVLIDRGCASACEVVASAIQDLHLGRLVGERTAGDAAGPAAPWFLSDGSVLEIPVAFLRGANGEIVAGIGVPPDDAAPVTAAALSAGRDPGIMHALLDLQAAR